MAKKPIGRPKLPAGESKDGCLVFRLRRDEQEAIEQAAAAAGQSVSDWIRAKIADKPPAKKDPPRGQTVLEWGQGDEKIVVITPSDLSVARWEKLRRYVSEVIKPRGSADQQS